MDSRIIASRITAYALQLESEAMALRADTLVTMAEGVRNDQMANSLERVARQLREILAEP